MEFSAGIQASLPGRYAAALFELAVDEGNVSRVEGDLETLSAALAESADLRSVINNPELGRKVQGSAILAVSDLLGLAPLTRRFLGTLAENRRLSVLPRIIRAFRTIAANQRGEVTAEVVSAHKLTDEQLETLRKKLTAREGRTVKLTDRVDPALLGGFVVTVGSKRIDGSIATRLHSLATAMQTAR